MKLRKNIILPAFILFIALGVRTADLGNMPAGFHRDEVISGYAGRFVLQNGRDFYGNFLPFFYIDKYGDFPPAIPMYFSGLSTIFFGNNVFAVRLPVALLGALTIIPIYFLVLQIFKSRSIAHTASLFLAIIPWHIVLSRATAEGIIALFFSCWGLVFLLKFINHQSKSDLIFATLLFGFCYLLYPSYRVLIPLVFLAVPIFFRFKNYLLKWVAVIILIFILLTVFVSSTDWGKGRYEQTSMFGAQSGRDLKIRAQIFAEEEGVNRIAEVKIFHNKAVLYTREFLRQYASYYSPQYLFANGGLPYRYTVSDQGLLYYIFVPLIFIGLLFFKDMDRRKGGFLIYLLIIAPMPSPLTLDDVPNVHRSMFMIIPLVLLAAFGLHKLASFVKNKKNLLSLYIIVFSVMAVELIYFSHMYFRHANIVKSIERGDTNKELIKYVIDNQANYDKVFMPVHDAYPIYYLFFRNNYDPNLIGQFGKGLTVDRIDNIDFSESYCPSKEFFENNNYPGNFLFIDREDCFVNENTRLKKIFTRHDGTMSYRILELVR